MAAPFVRERIASLSCFYIASFASDLTYIHLSGLRAGEFIYHSVLEGVFENFYVPLSSLLFRITGPSYLQQQQWRNQPPGDHPPG